MAEVKWIKIVTDIFDDEKILLIESMPEKYAIITCWFKLLCLAGKQNNSGVFMLNDRLAYTEEMLATVFRMELNTVRLALNTFEMFGMIERVEGVITIPNWGKHQSLESIEKNREQSRLRMQEYRKRQRALSEPACEYVTEDVTEDVTHDVTQQLRNVTQTDIDKKEKKKKEKDLEDIYVKKPARHEYGEYKNVLLSDEDMEKLKSEYPKDWKKLIERLSSYMASKGVSYKNHLATMRNWARKDGIKSAAEEQEAIAQASARMAEDMERMRKMLDKI